MRIRVVGKVPSPPSTVAGHVATATWHSRALRISHTPAIPIVEFVVAASVLLTAQPANMIDATKLYQVTTMLRRELLAIPEALPKRGHLAIPVAKRFPCLDLGFSLRKTPRFAVLFPIIEVTL